MFEDLFQISTSVSLLVAIVVLLVLHLFYSSFSSQEKRREPPGPKPLPLLGNVLQVDVKDFNNSLLNLAKKYGPVFTVYLGPKKVVVLAGYRTVKNALVNHAEEFGERDDKTLMYELRKGHGIIFTNGKTWREMRRFAVSTLKDLGMGKGLIADKIIEEGHRLIEGFEQYKDKAFNNTQMITKASSSIISALMFGRRFEYTDPVIQSLMDRNLEIIHGIGSASTQLCNVSPWIRSFLKNWTDINKESEGNEEEMKRIIADLKKTLNPEMCRSFVDAYLLRKLKLEESEIKDSLYDIDNLVNSTLDLFGAGTDTTSCTLSWCLLFMAKYPHIQGQVQKELNSVVGSRQVRVEDSQYLPYTNAVIHESQRLSSIVPIPRHKTSQDVTFQGYFIKEGTAVFPLLSSVLYDESEWETPHSFNPSHFLDKEGRFIRRRAFMPFSAGRRVCPGEALVRMELFLIFTSLLQRFHFTPPPGVTEDELDVTQNKGFIIYPSPHELCAVSRHGQSAQ